MNEERIRVLEINDAGATLAIDGVLDAQGQPQSFYAVAGEGEGEGEPEDAPVCQGPLSWEALLGDHLRPNKWLGMQLGMIHPSMTERVLREMDGFKGAHAERWLRTIRAVTG